MKKQVDHYGVFTAGGVNFLYQGGDPQNALGYEGSNPFKFNPAVKTMKCPHEIRLKDTPPSGELPSDPLIDFMRPGVAPRKKLYAVSDPNGEREIGEVCFTLSRMYGTTQRIRMASEMNTALLRRELSLTNLQPLVVIAQPFGFSTLIGEARQLLRFLPRKLLIVMEQPSGIMPSDAVRLTTDLRFENIDTLPWEAWGGFLTHQLCKGET